jgi:heparosan-N-sulfate-glucuronate 5-epimerase
MTTTSTGTELPRGQRGGFFSSASSFSLPVGPRIEPGSAHGYYIDFRIKADTPKWPPDWLPPRAEQLHVDVIQWGLGCYEHYLAGDGDEWLEAARDCGVHCVEIQELEGPARGGWIHEHPYRHTFPLKPRWVSAMAQGEGASLLVRLHLTTREDQFAERARLALEPIERLYEEGGVTALLDGRPFPQEYPTDPPSHVLNGGIFALLGWYDVAVALGEQQAMRRFEEAVETLASNIHRWDLGYWSRYDLFPHPVVNVASSSYHVLHVNQLRALGEIAPRPELEQAADRFAAYAESRLNRARAFVKKALFRVLVPRNRLLAGRLPWSRVRTMRPRG